MESPMVEDEWEFDAPLGNDSFLTCCPGFLSDRPGDHIFSNHGTFTEKT